MLITLQLERAYGMESWQALKYHAITAATTNIFLREMNTADRAMNRYLIENKKINLRDACLKIINDCEFECQDGTAIKVYTKHKKYELLANLITYGIGTLQGSSMLLDAFGKE